jgi:hypothetical protein
VKPNPERLLPLVLLLGCASPLAAEQAPALDVAAGFQAVRDPRDGAAGPRGLYAAVTGSVSPWVGVVGELGVGSGSLISRDVGFIAEPDLRIQLTHWTMLGGARVVRPGRVRPFAQTLFGLRRTLADGCANSVGRLCTMLDACLQKLAAIVQPGGGTAITLTRRLSVEARLDLQLNVTSTDEDDIHVEHPPRSMWRFATGAVLSFAP